MLTIAAGLVAAACAPSLSADLPSSVPAPPAPAAFDISGTLVAVLDGDTVEVETETGRLRIRLAGINAPEGGECYGDVASAYLERLTPGPVEAMVVGTDQFGRTLAYLWVRGIQLNLDMVSRGLALATTPKDPDPYGPSLLYAEEAAYGSRLGLWSPDSCGSGPLPELRFVPEASVFDPPGPDDRVLSAEQIVVVNRGDEPVDMTGWVLRDESSRHRYRFPQGLILGRGYIFVVSSDLSGWDPGGSPVWNNTGDMALLLDPTGRVVTRWRYGP